MYELSRNIIAILNAADQLGGRNTQFGDAMEAISFAVERNESLTSELRFANQMLHDVRIASMIFQNDEAQLLINDVLAAIHEVVNDYV